jgi:hypothetical protein
MKVRRPKVKGRSLKKCEDRERKGEVEQKIIELLKNRKRDFAIAPAKIFIPH